MMKQAFKLIAISVSFILPQSVSAQAAYSDGTQIAQPAEAPPESESTQQSGMPESSTNRQSTADSAKSAQNKQLLSAGLNAAAAIAFYKKCGKQCYPCCAMGAISQVQSGISRGAAAGSGRTYNAALTGLEGLSNINGELTFDDPAAQQGYEFANANGIKADSNGTVSTPNGEFKGSDFADEASMAAAGMDAGSIQLAMKAKKDAEDAAKKFAENYDEAKVVSMGLATGGGGGGRAPASSFDSGFDASAYLRGLRNPFGLTPKDKQNILAGKSISVGDEAIGVKVDDIFKMVHRRYQQKRSSNDFIETK